MQRPSELKSDRAAATIQFCRCPLGTTTDSGAGHILRVPEQNTDSTVGRIVKEPAMNQTFSSETRSIFITGLRNAHAMENQALSIMKPQADGIENYPSVAQKLREHIQETHGQIARLERILESLDEDASTLKDTTLSVVGTVTALGHTMASDEILKNSFANFAFENYEIAAYSSLLALAEAGGFSDAKTLLLENLREEQAMADWLKQNFRSVTLQFANLREAGETAKS
jgi:ferritin-like metal-binding protein YciE